jgi:phosphoglycolate phosphatase
MIGYWLVKTLEQRPTLAYPAVNTVLEENRGIFERVVNRMMTYYEQNPADHTRYFEGMESVLDHLEGRGIPWGIVTNKRSRYTQPLTEALEIHLRTPCIVSGDTTAESKPHPLPLIEASGRLGIDPAYCVYIGDAARDIEAGRRAGMMTLAALYGYINANEDIEGWGADDALEVPTDLIPWMDQQAG